MQGHYHRIAIGFLRENRLRAAEKKSMIPLWKWDVARQVMSLRHSVVSSFLAWGN